MENYKNSKIGQETAQKYGDILEMERPQTEESLRKHPRMTLQNRAKIFSPFSPLRGYDEQLAAEKQRTERVPKRILTEEETSALSDRLMQVTKGMTITVRYFKEDTAHPEVPAVGNYITLTGKADRIFAGVCYKSGQKAQGHILKGACRTMIKLENTFVLEIFHGNNILGLKFAAVALCYGFHNIVLSEIGQQLCENVRHKLRIAEAQKLFL